MYNTPMTAMKIKFRQEIPTSRNSPAHLNKEIDIKHNSSCTYFRLGCWNAAAVDP
jgi:hypothetical protein